MPTGNLVARLFIDGEMVSESLLTPDGPVEAISEMQSDLALQAGDRWWRLEITDPDKIIDPVVISNRPYEMRMPIPATPEVLAAPGFTCLHCGMTSHHPRDLLVGYCGNCHHFCKDVP